MSQGRWWPRVWTVISLQLYLLAAQLSGCWAGPWATGSFPGKELSSVRGHYHSQRKFHSEQPAPGEVLTADDGHFEFQIYYFPWMGKNSRELSNQGKSEK